MMLHGGGGVAGKHCSWCKAVLEFGQFYKRGAGWSSWCRACTRDKVKDWRRRNRAYVLAYMRKQNAAWRRQNPERDQAKQRVRWKRESEAAGGAFDSGRPDYAQRVAYYGKRCAYCAGPFQTLDHSIPLARGGSNFASNIRPICRPCNQSKYTKTPAEFLCWLAKNKLSQ